METKELKSGINEFYKMVNIPGVTRESASFSLFACSLSRQSAGSWSLKRVRPMLSAQKREGCFALSPKVQGGAIFFADVF
ncbi:hypothetical protein T10_1527 [Trichinella papuae]|uniref:Uncharacterized protein n=1 Tax=Trichinella papuae TaxID=268474 RepID=A0A0V1MXZ4_9BILA|nr:hypothetical protein T10_1527 [Trichinella papuae]